MPTLDQVRAIEGYIEDLLKNAEKLPALTGEPVFPNNSRKWLLWFNESAEVIRRAVPEGAYLRAQVDDLLKQASVPASNFENLKEDCIALLAAAKRMLRLEAKDHISDDFRRAVEIAVTDGYFKNWPFKGLIAVFGFTTAIFFGGTIYSTIQVSGIQKHTEEAQQEIRQQTEIFDSQVLSMKKDIEEKTKNIDQTIRAAISANNNEFDSILKEARNNITLFTENSKKSLGEEQARAVTSVSQELEARVQQSFSLTTANLQTDAKNLAQGWAQSNTKVSTALTEALSAVEQARKDAVARLAAGPAQMEGEKDAARAIIHNTQVTADNEIKALKNEVQGKQSDAITAIGASTTSVVKEADEGKKQIALQLGAIPGEIGQLVAATSSIDRALKNYDGDVTSILNRLNGQGGGSELGLVVRVLGHSFWLLLGSMLASFFALTLAGWAYARKVKIINAGRVK